MSVPMPEEQPAKPQDTDPTRVGELIRRQMERVQQGPLAPNGEAETSEADQPELFAEEPPAPAAEPEEPPASARAPQPAMAAAKTPRSRTPARVSLAKMARLESIRGRVARVTAERDQRTLPIELPSRKKRSRAEEETREELLSRLLDPELTLAETAKVLDVCAATVRRYADRGTLPHHRTPGNQRRFKLTDVLEFLARRDRSVVEDVGDVDF